MAQPGTPRAGTIHPFKGGTTSPGLTPHLPSWDMAQPLRPGAVQDTMTNQRRARVGQRDPEVTGLDINRVSTHTPDSNHFLSKSVSKVSQGHRETRSPSLREEL